MDLIKITIEFNNQKATYEIPEDTTIDEYINLFQSILIFLTFDTELVKELFKQNEI